MGQSLELSAEATLQALAAHGVVPVIRFARQDTAHRAVTMLYQAGFRTFEITLTTPGALELIAELNQRSDLLIGAGTVLTASDASRCLEAGARYVVTPVLLRSLAPLCREADVLCVMSGFTPTEVYEAWQHGASAVKIFPANSVGGPAHLRALKSVFPNIPLAPTGGVNLANLRDYFHAGAIFVGVGSDLLSERDLTDRDAADLITHARRYLEEVSMNSSNTSDTLIQQFYTVTTASVADAVDQVTGARGYMDHSIKPRINDKKVVGPAVTVKEVPSSEKLPPQHALDLIDSAAAGSVMVIGIDGESDVAVWGGLMTAGAVAKGFAGAVLDGGVRDVAEIRRDYGFPVFARSVSPGTTVGRFKTLAANVPVVCGDMTVTPGDLIVADSDGVVVVPQAHLEAVLVVALDIEKKEALQAKFIRETRSLKQGLAKYQRI